jgi:4a-hydroxytetrahydrobiopterin dehydratase
LARIKLSAAEIENSLSGLNGWEVSGVKLKKRFEFENFAQALEFVNKASEFAEKLDHHPDIHFGWGYAEFEITTHDAGGLTHNDFDLAKDIDGF